MTLYASGVNAAATNLRCILVGMPGAGKTAVGRALSALSGKPFVDLDVILYIFIFYTSVYIYLFHCVM